MIVSLSPEQLQPETFPPSELEKTLVRNVDRRYSKWGWRLFWSFSICVALSILINAGFISWRKSINEEVITIHNIQSVNSVELCPGETVRYQYNVSSDMISPTIGVVIFSMADNCPPQGE